MKKFQLIVLSSVLIFVGVGVFTYKYYFLNFPLKPDETSNFWNIEIRLSFDALKKPIKAHLYLPGESSSFIINSEQFLSGKYGLVTARKNGNRRATWSIRKVKGKQYLYYRAVIQKMTNNGHSKRSRYKPADISVPELEEPYLRAAEMLWNQIYAHSADLETIIADLFKRLSQPRADENVSLLLGDNVNSSIKQIETAIQLLAIAGIPARFVNGFDLKEDTLKVKAVHWIEVYFQKRWHGFDPETGGEKVPDSYMAWWRGSEPLYKIHGGTNPQIQVNAQKNEEEAIQSAIKQSKLISPKFLKFSLLNLPIQNQIVYRIILLIPLGALLVVLFRNIIGISTFGTFMPVLIALSFRETQLIWGIVLFSLVVTIGLSVRFYLENLKLLVVPRLSAVLIFVIMIIAVLNILTDNLGLSLGLSVSLFPIVILSMTIERMSILWEERGAGEALKQGVGTLFVSTMIYYLINNQTIEHIMFFFPELLLVLLAITILLGRYSGFRLLELYRFKVFIRKGQ